MTNKQLERWLDNPSIAMKHLYKNLRSSAPFDSRGIESRFSDETSYTTDGKNDLTVKKAMAKWLYNNDDEELFSIALADHFSYYRHYIIPLYSVYVETWDRQSDRGILYLTRTKNQVVTIMEVSWIFSDGHSVRIDYHKPGQFTIEAAVNDFINEAEDFTSVLGGFQLITKNIKKLENEGRIGGSIEYESYVSGIRPNKKAYVLVS